MDLRTTNVDVHIDALVLDGFQGIDCVVDRIQRGLASELCRRHVGVRTYTNNAFISRDAISLPADASGETIGIRVADSIIQGINR